MKQTKIVADGALRFESAREKAADESVEMKYAAQLAQAGPEEKMKILECIAAEKIVRDRTLAHRPSTRSLW